MAYEASEEQVQLQMRDYDFRAKQRVDRERCQASVTQYVRQQ